MLQIEPQLYVDLNIASGGTDSNAVPLSVLLGQFTGLIWPAAWDGTTVTLEGSWDGGATFVTVETLTFAANTYKDLDPGKYRGVKLIRLVAASAQSGGARTVKLVGSVI